VESKSILTSKTILGILLAALGAFVDFGPQLQQVLPASMAAMAGKAVIVAGLLLAIYGRIKAAVPVTLTGSKGSGGFARPGFLVLMALLSLLAVSLAACSTVQPKPETPAQTLALAEADYTAIVKAATSARASGLINEEVAAKLTPIFDRANGALALAHEALEAHNSGDFTRWLGVVNRAMVEANALVPR
jgi:hypothetical protein